MPSNNKIPLIYILGSSRSGSTILELLLNAHPEIWATGEAEYLPWELKEPRKPCGCGSQIVDCPFWQQALPKVPIGKGSYPIEYFKNPNRAGKTLKIDLLPGLLLGKIGSRQQRAIKEYGVLNAEYFSTVKRTAEAQARVKLQWLVDSSKDLYRLHWLNRSGCFDIKVIYIVRDPRAFVYSKIARTGMDGPKGLAASGDRSACNDAKWRGVIRQITAWMFQNAIMSRMINSNFDSANIYRLQYEALAQEPNKILNEISQWLGVEFPENASLSFRHVENHAISGNPSRWKADSIRLNEVWREKMPHSIAQTIWGITWPLRCKLGYRKNKQFSK